MITLLHYKDPAGNRPWKIERWDLLAAEFDLNLNEGREALGRDEGREARDGRGARGERREVRDDEAEARDEGREVTAAEKEEAAVHARALHGLFCGMTRQWTILRRLYGIQPVVLSPDEDLDMCRVFTRKEVCDEFGLSQKTLEAELDTMRAFFAKTQERAQAGTPPAPPADEKQNLVFEFEEELFRELGFDVRILKDLDERRWFNDQVIAWRDALKEPASSVACSEMLMSGLHLRRQRARLLGMNPDEDRYKSAQREMQEAQKAYREQALSVNKLFPYVGQMKGKMGLRVCISELFEGWVKYRSDSDNDLLDGISTAAEIEIEHRQDKQRPQVAYRLGATMLHLEAKHFLHDPNYRTKLPDALLGRLDEAHRRLVEENRDETAEPLVDLLAEGDRGEFPPLKAI